jgi:hypothetical protein
MLGRILSESDGMEGLALSGRAAAATDWTPHVSPVIPSIMVAGARREVTGILAEEGVPVGARSRVGARDARARRLTEGR